MVESIVVLVDDLFFWSKIMETAKAIGIKVVRGEMRDGSVLLGKSQPQAVILDLNSRGIDALECIKALKTDPATCPIRLIGFVSHVQEDLISAARAAGCDLVLARSVFTKRLPELLRSWSEEVRQSPSKQNSG